MTAETRRRPDDPAFVYEVHVFCCTNQRPATHRRGCCASKGSQALADYMCRRAMVTAAQRHIRINLSSCLNLCEFGPAMVIYPEGVSEGPVSAEVSITLAGGDVVHATITHEAVTELGIKAGVAATAVFKASSVILAIGA